MTLTHPRRTWLAVPLAAVSLLMLSPTGPAFTAPTTMGAAGGFDLSAAQKVRMETGRAKFQKALMALQADPKLSEAQKRTKAMALAQMADRDALAILTPAQRELALKQRAIDDTVRQEVLALRTNTKLTDKQKQARFEALMQVRQTALLATLPPALRARAERTHQVAMARATEAKRVGEQLQKSLSKTTQQQIQQATLAARSKMQVVSAEATLSQADKASKIQTMGRELEAKIQTMLTPQQRVQWTRYHQLVSSSASQ